MVHSRPSPQPFRRAVTITSSTFTEVLLSSLSPFLSLTEEKRLITIFTAHTHTRSLTHSHSHSHSVYTTPSTHTHTIALASMALLSLEEAKVDILKVVELQPTWPKTDPQKQGVCVCVSTCMCMCVCVYVCICVFVFV